eukprot:m.159735 g.159735  ORF g.159735 m.159735 type:complete len:485 (-) comp53023_c0_seq4:99-1553(-)
MDGESDDATAMLETQAKRRRRDLEVAAGCLSVAQTILLTLADLDGERRRRQALLTTLLTAFHRESAEATHSWRLEVDCLTETRFRETFRMFPEDFECLVRECSLSPSWPKREPSRSWTSISDEALLAASLHRLMHATSFRNLSLLFGMRESTICRLFPAVLSAIAELKVEDALIKFPTTRAELDEAGRQWATGLDANDRRFEFLRNCVAAGDGTSIPVKFTEQPENIDRWRGRKGVFTQNLLVLVNHDKTICAALAMGEGSIFDGSLLSRLECLKNLPDDKFILFDSGTGLMPKVLSPIKGVRYHLKEWASPVFRPKNHEETFNLFHATKRASRVEVAIGLLKARFKCLKEGLEASYETTQLQTVACLHLHNFVQRRVAIEDRMTRFASEPTKACTRPLWTPPTRGLPPTTPAGLREHLARQTMAQYLHELWRRRDAYFHAIVGYEADQQAIQNHYRLHPATSLPALPSLESVVSSVQQEASEV